MITEGSLTALKRAVRINALEMVQLLLDAGADDIDGAEKNHQCPTLIQLAAYNSNTEMVQILLDLRVNVDGHAFSSDKNDPKHREWGECYCRTALQLAVENENNGVMVRLLLTAGANIEGLGHGPTPLEIAAQHENDHLVKLLVRNGANVNATAWKQEGRTALQSAVQHENRSLMDFLLSKGADINAPPALEDGLTAIQVAVESGDIGLVEELIALGADIHAPPSPVRGRTCLQIAAGWGSIKMISKLIKLGAEVNAAPANKSGVTALEAAMESGNLLAVQMLVAAGMDNNSILSALPSAIEREDLDMVQKLLNMADLRGGTSFLDSSLVTAAKLGAVDLVLYLLDAGASVNGTSGSPAETALLAAAYRGHVTVASILLDAKADIHFAYMAKTYDDSITEMVRPLARAIWGNNMELVQLLLSRGANINGSTDSGIAELAPLDAAFHSYPINEEVIRTLINAGADVNRSGKYHSLPLIIAARRGNIGLINLLLEVGANVNGVNPTSAKPASMDDYGNNVNVPNGRISTSTALQAAALDGNRRVVDLLLQHGANCNAPPAEESGVTALQAAAINGNLRVVSTLLEAGAEINAPAAQSNGRTALEAAAEHGRHDIVCLLLDNDRDIKGLELRCSKAAEYAEREGYPVIARRLREYKVA